MVKLRGVRGVGRGRAWRRGDEKGRGRRRAFVGADFEDVFVQYTYNSNIPHTLFTFLPLSCVLSTRLYRASRRGSRSRRCGVEEEV